MCCIGTAGVWISSQIIPLSIAFVRINTKWQVAQIDKKYQKLTQITTFYGKWVIHIPENEFMRKIELYTKLFTLSTENKTKNEVYIVKNSNVSFVQIP
jgi:hypothetical protein